MRSAILALLLIGCLDAELPHFDPDGDGFLAHGQPVDCAPDDASIHPLSDDPWGDGLDANCDGSDGIDGDGDGHAANAEPPDCDDTDGGVYPSAVEVQDDKDNDCDGTVDEGTDAVDDDGDGFCEGIDPDTDGTQQCIDGAEPGDCDDADPERHPDAWEGPSDSVDLSCDGVVGAVSLLPEPVALVAGASFGWSVSAAGAGDLDGDGLDDVVITDIGEGTVGVFFGASLAEPGVRGLSNADVVITADEPGFGGPLVGRGVAYIGADGQVDLLVGAPAQDGNGYWGQGRVYALEGPLTGPSTVLSAASATVTGAESSDSGLGQAIVVVGDIDGDGLDDVMLGTRYDSSGGPWAGALRLVLGAALAPGGDLSAVDSGGVWLGDAAESAVGYVVAGLGDIDGDGLDDVAVGAPDHEQCSGRVYVMTGSGLVGDTAGSFEDAHAWFDGATWQCAGYGVAALGDLDGDGLEELAVAGFEWSEARQDYASRVWIVDGAMMAEGGSRSLAEARLAVRGEFGDAWGGLFLSTAGDVDGDGLSDLLLGLPEDDPGDELSAGRVLLFRGSSLATPGTLSTSDADAAFVVGGDGSFLGSLVAGAGDVDGDGRGDLLLGAVGYGAGRVWVVPSPW